MCLRFYAAASTASPPAPPSPWRCRGPASSSAASPAAPRPSRPHTDPAGCPTSAGLLSALSWCLSTAETSRSERKLRQLRVQPVAWLQKIYIISPEMSCSHRKRALAANGTAQLHQLRQEASLGHFHLSIFIILTRPLTQIVSIYGNGNRKNRKTKRKGRVDPRKTHLRHAMGFYHKLIIWKNQNCCLLLLKP